MLLSLAIPISSNTKYRFLTKYNILSNFKEILIEEFFKHNQINESTNNSLDEFLKTKINENCINTAGSCKYCNTLDINLQYEQVDDIDQKNKSNSLNNYLLNKIDQCKGYNTLITKFNLIDLFKTEQSIGADNILSYNNNSNVCLNEALASKLLNIENLTISDVTIEYDENMTKENCFKMIKNIEFINNNLPKVPNFLLNLSNLVQLILENNPINELPSEIFFIKTLKSIVFTKLSIIQLPNLKITSDENNKSSKLNLNSLIISQTLLNNLSNIFEIIDLVNLKKFVFEGVNLLLPEIQQNWPKFLCNMETFTNTYCPVLLDTIEANRLFKEFDYDKNFVLNYTEIQHLNGHLFEKYPRLGDNNNSSSSQSTEMHHNDDLPIQLFQCTSLQYLDLSFQAIKQLPDAIECLKNLKILKLKYCIYLETLSASLASLTELIELDITGCVNLKTPPVEIQRRGISSIIAYLKRLRLGSVTCKRTKLMLVGHGASGKTSLANSLLDIIYNNTTQIVPTLTDGIQIREWSVPLDDDGDGNSKLTFSV